MSEENAQNDVDSDGFDLPLDLPLAQDSDAVLYDLLLERVAEVNRLQHRRDFELLNRRVIEIVIELTGAERGVLLRFSGNALSALASHNFPADELSTDSFVMAVATNALRDGESVASDSANEDPRFGDYRPFDGSVACIPVTVADQFSGCIYVDHPKVREAFASQTLMAVTRFGEQVAPTLQTAKMLKENATLTDQLQRRLTERTEELYGLETLLSRALSQGDLQYDYTNIVHDSPKMKQVLAIVDRVVDSDLPVLIIGESGTGKELLARAIHYQGPRKHKPFVPVNCGAISPNLMESEFFGHKKGAFTGADRNKDGLFVEANGGTLVLDEIGELPIAMQIKLLRALQENQVTPVGGSRPIPLDVRVISATNKDLLSMIKDKKFRDDLYYRIAVVTILLPPLRERAEDIEPLIQHFLAKITAPTGEDSKSIAPQLMKRLKKYHWPGNIRELENVIKYLSIFAENNVISQTPPLLHQPVSPSGPSSSLLVPYGTPLKEIEEKLISATLDRTGNKKTRTAEILKMDRVTLYRRLKRTHPGLIGKHTKH